MRVLEERDIRCIQAAPCVVRAANGKLFVIAIPYLGLNMTREEKRNIGDTTQSRLRSDRSKARIKESDRSLLVVKNVSGRAVIDCP